MTPRHRRDPSAHDRGFTLVELLTVIIVIGVLTAIAIPVFLNQRNKASTAAARTQMRYAINEIALAREEAQKSTQLITGSNCSDCACRTLNPLPKVTDPGFATTQCGINWTKVTARLAAASGSPVGSVQALFTDPWGHPILLDENEFESGCATPDALSSIGATDHWSGFASLISVDVPRGGFC